MGASLSQLQSITIAGAIVFAATLLAPPPAASAHPLELVRPDVGEPLLTHGNDPKPPASGERELRSGLPSGYGYTPGSVERPPVCASDYHQHFIYARPRSGPDHYASSVERIRAAVRRMNAILNVESIASGGGTADYKVRCDSAGKIAVGGLTSEGRGFEDVVEAARAEGYRSQAADYVIFFDGGGTELCGTASYEEDDRLELENASNRGGGYAVVYSDCWETEIPMHESGHLMGAVQYAAPHGTGSGGHCFQEHDVMCYAPDGGDRNQFSRVDCESAPRFDCGFDDYFDAAPESGEWLASHWNLGSPLNRFIVFGERPPSLIDQVTGTLEQLLGAGSSKGSATRTARAPGEWSLFTVAVTGRTRALTVRLRSSETRALTLYLRARKPPSRQRFACRAQIREGAARCVVSRPQRGRWVAGVLSRPGAAGKGYRIQAKLRRR